MLRKPGPTSLELPLAILFFLCGDFRELGIDLWEFGFVQAQPGDVAFVVDRDRGLADHGLLDVVDRDELAEDSSRVGVVLLDRLAGEADERGVRLCFTRLQRQGDFLLVHIDTENAYAKHLPDFKVLREFLRVGTILGDFAHVQQTFEVWLQFDE